MKSTVPPFSAIIFRLRASSSVISSSGISGAAPKFILRSLADLSASSLSGVSAFPLFPWFKKFDSNSRLARVTSTLSIFTPCSSRFLLSSATWVSSAALTLSSCAMNCAVTCPAFDSMCSPTFPRLSGVKLHFHCCCFFAYLDPYLITHLIYDVTYALIGICEF